MNLISNLNLRRIQNLTLKVAKAVKSLNIQNILMFLEKKERKQLRIFFIS